MQANIEQYIRNFRIFYQQLSKGHPKEEQLNRQFKNLIEKELRKWKKGYNPKQADLQSTSETSLLAKLRQNRTVGKSKDKINVEAMYLSSKLQNVVVFGYLFLLFESKNVQTFEYLQQQLKQPLANKQVFSDKALRKLTFVWGKFDQVIYGKRKIVRFEKQLQEYFKQLPQSFIDLLYSIITRGQVLSTENQQVYFQQLTKIMSIRIDYFQINNNDVLKISNFGTQGSASLKMGCLTHENVFVFVMKMPEKKEKQVNKEITLGKFSAISQTLSKMYVTTTKEYFNLNNLKNRGGNIFESSNKLTQSSNKLRETEFTTI